MIRCTSCWPSPPSGHRAQHRRRRASPGSALAAAGAERGRDPLETLCHVILPGVLGHILTGLLAMASCGSCWCPAGMLGVSAGMGYFILDTRDRLAYRIDGDGAVDRPAGLPAGRGGAGAVSALEPLVAGRDGARFVIRAMAAMAPSPAPGGAFPGRHEPMTISTLVPLIGHTSASAAADCMLGLGMKKMPRATRPPGAHPGQAGVAGIRSHRVLHGQECPGARGRRRVHAGVLRRAPGIPGSCPSACRWPWTGSRWTRRWVGPWTRPGGRGPDLPPGCLPDHRVLWRGKDGRSTFRFTRRP